MQIYFNYILWANLAPLGAFRLAGGARREWAHLGAVAMTSLALTTMSQVRAAAGWTLAAAAALGLVLFASVLATMELQAHSLRTALERVEAARASPRRVAAMATLVTRLDETQPAFGGAPRYWDYAARGYLLAAGMDAGAPGRREELLGQARAAGLRALAGRPHNHGPWSRLAALDLARDGALSQEGADALRHAARVAPYRERLAQWRFNFMAPLWEELPLDLRELLLDDAAFLWRRPNEWLYRRVVTGVDEAAPETLRAALRARITDLQEPPALRPALRDALELDGGP